ncbi:hypothetical protein AB0C27_01825 [Nonomuraea sp. NPDC048882]|uniref:hypothetical protein n=1 Tax=unclassified Nonomuraea TaxID=2593643 RepID=UPI000A58A122
MSLRKRPLPLVLAVLLSVPLFATTTGTAHAALITYCNREIGNNVECGSASYLSITGGSVEAGRGMDVYLYTDSNVSDATYSSKGSSGHTTMTHRRLSPAFSTCKWVLFKGKSHILCKYRN